jgi:signal transduction histidine kinase
MSDPDSGATPRLATPADRDRLAELGQLAGGLVHELKNPIGVITLNAELLLGQPSPALPAAERERQEKRLKRILDSARSLQAIVNSFLTYAKPGRPDPDAVDLNQLLGELLDGQADLLDAARIQVSFHRDEALAMLPADVHQLRSIFLNLITNAREALATRPLAAGVSDRKLLVITRAGKDTVRVVIANNGPAFDEKVAAHLFEPFISSKEDGTGLGLAIVRRLVELHHGTITASSDPAQGVSFTLEFPTPLGPAKPRTELPLPTVEADIRDDGTPLRTPALDAAAEATPPSALRPPEPPPAPVRAPRNASRKASAIPRTPAPEPRTPNE